MGSGDRVEALHRRAAITLAFVATLAVAPGTKGAQPGYEVTVGIGESDNIALQPHGGPSETIGMQGVDFTWHDRRPRLDADIDGAVSYLEYLHHTFGNQVIGNVIGDVRATLVPELLFWDVADNFGQGRVNSLSALTPENRENINYFSTGPELALPLGSTTLLDISAHYAKVNYQVSPLSGNRESGAIALLHKLSSRASISLNVRDERVNYASDATYPDYDHQEAFVRFDAQGQRTTLGVDLGFSKIRDPAFPASGVLARMQLSRKVSPFSTVALSFAHQFSDATDVFRIGQTFGGATLSNTQSVQPTGTPFKSDIATLAWNFQRSRTGFGLSLEHYKDAYQQPSTLDDNRTQAEASMSRALTPTLQVVLSEQYYYQQLKDIDGSTTELTTDIHLTWRAGRRLSVTLDFIHSSRHSDIATSAYKENRAWLMLGYGRPAQVPPGPATPPLPRQSLY
jgi:hypothetical protein